MVCMSHRKQRGSWNRSSIFPTPTRPYTLGRRSTRHTCPPPNRPFLPDQPGPQGEAALPTLALSEQAEGLLQRGGP